MQSPEVDSNLKKALGDVLLTTEDIIGMDGHRSQLRHRGHTAGWHFCSSTLFRHPELGRYASMPAAPAAQQSICRYRGLGCVGARSAGDQWIVASLNPEHFHELLYPLK